MAPEGGSRSAGQTSVEASGSGGGLTVAQRRVLRLLVDSQMGMTEPALRRLGFSPTLLVGLVIAGYAVTKPQTMKAAGKTFGIVRFMITNAGRRAIG